MDSKVKEAIIKVANDYGIEPAALLAVKLVETGDNNGFLDSGEPQILFEGHVFYKYYKNTVPASTLSSKMKVYPNILYPKWDKSKYYGGIKEHSRLQQATKINREFALMSTSWGLFQIMGFNWKLCGCESLQEFINMNYKDLDSQVKLGVEFLINSKLVDKLKDLDWAGFAKKYNGPSYAKNAYDQKLQNAYNNFKRALS